jgi:hypothetical protein
MNIADLLNDKSLKPKAKTETLSSWVLENKISVDELIEFAKNAKDPIKATCIEALEFVTKQNPSMANKNCFDFASESLQSKAPSVKWESARVIGNTAHLFPDNLNVAIGNLLINTEHEGTVVRWSAAFALGEILKLKTNLNKDLIPAFEAIIDREEKSSIKKIYLDAIKKAKK